MALLNDYLAAKAALTGDALPVPILTANPRQKASLERIKQACDYLDAHGLKISPATGEAYCLDRKWDGPKAQSIRNSKDVLLRFVVLRRSGQTVHRRPSPSEAGPEIADESLRAYVQLLKQERDQAVASRARIEAGLRSIPGIKVDELIRVGMGAPAAAAAASSSEVALSPQALSALGALFDATKLQQCGLELHRGRLRQVATKNVLLEKPEVEALLALCT